MTSAQIKGQATWPNSKGPGIALALSGGGVRAMAFHAGVLRWLSELGDLERVTRISTVSGGSLLVGLVFQASGLRWPSSADYLGAVYPQLRTSLCSLSLQYGAMRQLSSWRNWRYLLSRANLLGLALRNEWGVESTLADLPTVPEWSINGTTAENGKRFRFKASNMGDYDLGYAADAGRFPLASALAVSAAFPGGFGPLTLRTDAFVWKKRPWGAQAGTEVEVVPPHPRLHLYDGGVYDNLGLEPFFDAGRSKSKIGDECILVSDAGAPLAPGFGFNPLSVFRLKRVADIMSDQSRALRVRTFVNYLQSGRNRGAFVPIGGLDPAKPTQEASFAMNFPTTLRALKVDEFDRLSAHGFAIADGVEKQLGALRHRADDFNPGAPDLNA